MPIPRPPRAALLAVLVLLTLSACRLFNPAAAPTASAPPPTVVAPATAAPLPSAALPTAALPTDAPASPTRAPELVLDLDGLAASYQLETVAAVAPGADLPFWDVLPEYRRLTLDGYAIPDHRWTPQIFIYPVAGLDVNEGAAQAAADLQTILAGGVYEQPNLPFLPPINAGQVFVAQAKDIDFGSGVGVRYLTAFAQGLAPISNFDLLYTFQGLSADGLYYVAVVLPVHSDLLPADDTITGQEPLAFSEDFPFYVESTAMALDMQPETAFTPDLAALDALVASLTLP